MIAILIIPDIILTLSVQLFSLVAKTLFDYPESAFESITRFFTNSEFSSFHVSQGTTGKVQFLFFRSVLMVLNNFLFWEEN